MKNVETTYQCLLSAEPGGEKVDIREANTVALEALAKMVAFYVDADQSLVDYLDNNNIVYPADKDRWYAICCAAAYLVIQQYFREYAKSVDGGDA